MADIAGAIWNRFLRVNLSEGSCTNFTLPKEYFSLYLGGKALGTRLMLDEKIYRADPLSPNNKVFMLCGPLTGTMVPGVGKMVSLTRSPLTGIYMDSGSGGRMPHNLKGAGYDGLVLEGASNEPVYLYIHHDRVELRPAGFLWGKGCFETEKLLRERYGPDVAIGCIGPAGENRVLYANVGFDFYHQAGRGGLGAVLGSKKLKAIVVYGDRPIPLADPVRVQAITSRAMAEGKADQKVAYRIRYGTFSTFDLTHKLGMTPVRNFTEGITDLYEELKAESLRNKYVVKDLACFACPMACGKAAKFRYRDRDYILGGPEYESIALLGSNLDVPDPGMLYLSWLCDDLGMDTMSTGVTIACAMEAAEKGLLPREDFDAPPFWGSVEQAAKLIEDIAYRRGVGEVIAQGVRRFARRFNLVPLAMEVKGLELAAYDPRGSFGYALAMGVADRGGCHRRCRPLYREMQDPDSLHRYEGKPELVVELENDRAFYHSLVICDFIPPMWPLKPRDYAELVHLSTGLPFKAEDVAKVGERAFAQNRLFNIYCGIGSKDDTLPGRFFTEAMSRGPAAGVVLDREKFREMVACYYRLRGWDEEGRPTAARLAQLQIEEGVSMDD